MSRTLYAALFALGATAAAADRQLLEGKIALNRFGSRLEMVSDFLIQEGASEIPFRVPPGKLFTVHQVSATCSFYLSGASLTLWTIRASPESPVHHYLSMRPPTYEADAVWVGSGRLRIPVAAGNRPVATFQRSRYAWSANDGCVGSWIGSLEDAPKP